MSVTSIAKNITPGLLKVVERAKQKPEMVFLSLAHLIDKEALKRAYERLRKDAAVGVDGITKEEYGQALESNIEDLHERLRTMRWRHQPIRRVRIPKEGGKTRPLGISATEDKIVQGAIREVLEAIYEPIFRDCSHGFRRGRSAHDALRRLNQVVNQNEGQWILEFDVVSFFDSLDRKKLIEMFRNRVVDGSLLRLIGKCLRAGILEGEEYTEPEDGAVQGSVLSPILGNIYLHHVLDLWFEREVRPRLSGKAHLIRYADDGVLCFEREEDARRVMEVLERRMGRFGLKLHADKTRLLPFGRPQTGARKAPATFDFLGFTLYWRRTRRGFWMPTLKTRTARLRRAKKSVSDGCRRHRHESVERQHAALKRKLVGHFNYFGVNGNGRCLRLLARAAERAWHKWLNRRSQRSCLNWTRFKDLLQSFPLPKPTIRVQLWEEAP